MPALPLNETQLADAARLKHAWNDYKKKTPGTSQEKVAAECGWKTQASFNQYLLGKIPLNLPALLKMCKAMGGINPSVISPTLAAQLPPATQTPTASAAVNLEAGPALKAFREIPIIGEVKGGDDGYLTELDYPAGHGEGVVDYPTSDPDAYALRVRGDSMHPRYRAGEFVVVEPGVEPQPGDDVVVALHDERKLLKELNWMRDGEVQLLSINNHFGPLTLPLADILRIQLVAGRVRRGAIRR